MAVSVHRYPRYEEALRVCTWSSGIRAFKGYRDFRAYCGDELVVSASSVWLYFNIAAKTICRVPREIAAGFPTHPGAVFFPELEKLLLEAPAEGSPGQEISVRYSDFDGNGHVNNTAYFDYLQTALAAGGHSPRPAALQIQFLKEITPETPRVRASLEVRGGATAFGLGGPAGLFANGFVS
jgi:acyl-ACP thioesterase